MVPGWLDKALKWRHHATPFLDSVLLLAPNPEWVKTLPNAKLPDRSDFVTYGNDLAARVRSPEARLNLLRLAYLLVQTEHARLS